MLILGKIKEADVELIRGVYLGLELTFSLNGGESEVSSGGKYTANTSERCEYETRTREEAYSESFEFIKKTLKKAGVDSVSELKGIPVEVVVGDAGGAFKTFRILEEVL